MLYHQGIVTGVYSLILGWIYVVFTFTHLTRRSGARAAVLIFATICVVSFLLKAVGVNTGVVFRDLCYPDDKLGPLLLGAPPLIQFQYFAMGYASLFLARGITGYLTNSLMKTKLVILSILSGLIMTGLDLASDPVQSTELGDWVWVNGGAFFGVPLHNFIVWFIPTTIFFLLVNYILTKNQPKLEIGTYKNKTFYLLGVLPYGTFPAGIVWMEVFYDNSDISLSMAGIALFAVIPLFIIGLVKLKELLQK